MPAYGKYISQADLEDLYSVEAIRAWSVKGGDAQVADERVIFASILRAEALVETRLSRLYVTPLLHVDGVNQLDDDDRGNIVRIAVPLAAYDLYTSRGLLDEDATGGKLSAGRKAALEELQLYADGRYPLKAFRIDRTPIAPQIVP